MRRRNILWIVALFFSAAPIKAQQASSQVMDLYAHRRMNFTPSGQIDTTIFNVDLSYKITNIDSTDVIYILFGSVKDSGDVFIQPAVKVFANNKYYLSYNGTNEEMNANIESIHFFSFTPSQWDATKFITIFLVDAVGRNSEKIYFEKDIY